MRGDHEIARLKRLLAEGKLTEREYKDQLKFYVSLMYDLYRFKIIDKDELRAILKAAGE